jgi:hypothetical protein
VEVELEVQQVVVEEVLVVLEQQLVFLLQMEWQ